MGFVQIDGFDAIGMHKSWMSIFVESVCTTKATRFSFESNKMNVAHLKQFKQLLFPFDM